MALFILSACSDNIEFTESNISTYSNLNNNNHRITESKALDIINKVFKETRNNITEYSISHVISDNPIKTRTSIGTDTVAYIFNRGTNNGFVIVSTDDRVFPILAYSTTGHFSNQNIENPAYACFISKIDEYMANINEDDTTVVVPEDYLTSCVVINPKLPLSWDQQGDFAKYVEMEHPTSPVGCVAVAVGQIMAYCKDSLNYHDITYHFDAIRKATNDSMNIDRGNNDENCTIDYSYDEAIDYIAKLLYWVGKDLFMKYTPGEPSSTYSYLAPPFLARYGYNVRENNLITYQDYLVMERVEQGDLVYIDGRDRNTNGGHAFIVDGGTYCYESMPINSTKGEGMRNIMLHCDWGWGGLCNGYFSGDVFSVREFDFERMTFFSVRKSGPQSLPFPLDL